MSHSRARTSALTPNWTLPPDVTITHMAFFSTPTGPSSRVAEPSSANMSRPTPSPALSSSAPRRPLARTFALPFIPSAEPSSSTTTTHFLSRSPALVDTWSRPQLAVTVSAPRPPGHIDVGTGPLLLDVQSRVANPSSAPAPGPTSSSPAAVSALRRRPLSRTRGLPVMQSAPLSSSSKSPATRAVTDRPFLDNTVTWYRLQQNEPEAAQKLQPRARKKTPSPPPPPPSRGRTGVDVPPAQSMNVVQSKLPATINYSRPLHLVFTTAKGSSATVVAPRRVTLAPRVAPRPAAEKDTSVKTQPVRAPIVPRQPASPARRVPSAVRVQFHRMLELESEETRKRKRADVDSDSDSDEQLEGILRFALHARHASRAYELQEILSNPLCTILHSIHFEWHNPRALVPHTSHRQSGTMLQVLLPSIVKLQSVRELTLSDPCLEVMEAFPSVVNLAISYVLFGESSAQQILACFGHLEHLKLYDAGSPICPLRRLTLRGSTLAVLQWLEPLPACSHITNLGVHNVASFEAGYLASFIASLDALEWFTLSFMELVDVTDEHIVPYLLPPKSIRTLQVLRVHFRSMDEALAFFGFDIVFPESGSASASWPDAAVCVAARVGGTQYSDMKVVAVKRPKLRLEIIVQQSPAPIIWPLQDNPLLDVIFLGNDI
ncbi:hypothetical protein C8F01DRAFT_1371202 [Mycena amicta]|nr:hypothetical protein C8F01DRAFT_1371202 [Mycena amicta]